MKMIMTLLSITLILFTLTGCEEKKTEKEAINKSGAVDWSKMPRRYKKD